MCGESDKDCVSNITIDTNDCLAPCEGIFADVLKHDAETIDEKYFEPLLKSYYKYKRFFDISEDKYYYH